MKTRIAKFLSDSSVVSRRKAEELIVKGAVSVNGETINSPVFFVDENDTVKVNGKIVAPRKETKLYAFHKPVNVMTTSHDPMGRKTIYDCLPNEYKNLKYIGRLDYKTSGLLLLTDDGDLARKFTLPRSNIPRVYIATVKGKNLSSLNRAQVGITIDGIKYRPLKIDVVSKNNSESVLQVETTEGKKNEIRIILRTCGLPVKKLHRISFGNIRLGKLPIGKIIQLPQKYIDLVKKSL